MPSFRSYSHVLIILMAVFIYNKPVMDKNVLVIISSISAVLSMVVNAFFIYVSCKKERKSIGTYRYLLVAFAIYNILYSSVEYIAKPVNFIYGHSIMSFNNGIITNVPALDPLFMGLFFSMHGIECALLVLHFLYRYIVVCRPDKKNYFENSKLAIWAAFNLVWGLIYFLIVIYWFGPTKECYEYAGEAVRNNFHRDLHELPHMCILTYQRMNNSLLIYWKPTVGLAAMMLMTIITFIIMICLGVQTSRTLKRAALSRRTISLQKQMLIALTIQALLPCVLAFIPRFIMLFFVIMELSPPSLFKYLPLIITFSITVIDPVAIMLTISDYRRAIFKIVMSPVRTTTSSSMATTVNVLSLQSVATSPRNHHDSTMSKQVASKIY